MRYFAIFLIIAGMFTVMFMLKGGGPDLPEDFPSITVMSPFYADSLTGNWSGEGLLHFPDVEKAMVIDGEFSVEFDSAAKRYRTETQISGHEFSYADSGFISIRADSVIWDLWDNGNRKMAFKGILAKDIVWVVYDTPEYEYRQTLFFPSGNSLYLRTERYKDQQLQNWLELTWRQK